jgi:hypothetical protein
LWRELRKIMSPPWLWRARFFHTARERLWRASHDQDQQQRLAKAHDQRNTVAHGLDRDLVGFDGTISTFGELVCAVERWTPVALHRFLRLLHHTGSKDTALDELDRVADPAANPSSVLRVLATVQ